MKMNLGFRVVNKNKTSMRLKIDEKESKRLQFI
jgi:hypothetical protein